MKKKITLFSLVLVLCLSLIGCGSTRDEVDYDQEAMEGTANALITGFSSMDAEDLEVYESLSEYELNYWLMQSGLPISADDFITMMEAWFDGEDECGKIESVGEYSLETSSTDAVLKADYTAEERDGTIEFAFDKEMNLETMTINASMGTGEILKKAGMNTLMGMGIVFLVLILISFIIYLFKFIPIIQDKLTGRGGSKTTAEDHAENENPPVATETPQTEDGELIAVIAAAVAAEEGTSPDGFVVRSVKRRKTNHWN